MFDLQYLKENFGADSGLLKEVFSAYAAAGEGALSEFQVAIEDEDSAAFAAACHKFKSSTRTVGDGPLSDLCDELERQATDKGFTQLQSSYPLLKERIELSIEAARNLEL